jgi:hypothetical protein
MDRTLAARTAPTALTAHTVTTEHWALLKVQFQHRTASRLSRQRSAARSAAHSVADSAVDSAADSAVETVGTKGPELPAAREHAVTTAPLRHDNRKART